MRTFNVRLAAILVAVTVVFGIGVYVVHGIQVKRNAQAFLDQADEADKRAKDAVKDNDPWEEQKARRDVIKNLSWYVQLMPYKVDALERLGLMRAGQSYDPAGRWPPKDRRMFAQASDNLEKVLRQEPERKASRQELAKMMMFWHRFQDAKEHLQILLKESPKDAELLEQLAQCQAQTGSADAAIETYKKAIHCGPGQLTAYEKLAGLLRSPGVAKPKEADQWMGDGPPAEKGLVAANPKSAKAHYLRSRYLMDVGQGEEAVKEAMKALDLAPDDADVLLLASRCDLMRGEPEKALKLVDHGLKLHPANSDMYRIEAEVELHSGKPDGRVDRAVAALRRGLKATQQKVGSQQTAEVTGHRIDLLLAETEVLIDAHRLKEVQETVAELRKTIDELRKENVFSEGINYWNAVADYLLARTEFVKENWRVARDGLEKVRVAVIANPGLVVQIDFLIGQCCRQLGNRTQEQEAYRRALNINPSYAAARGALIDAYLAMGKIDEAIEEFRQLANYGRLAPTAAVQMARMLLLWNLRQDPTRRDWPLVERALADAEKAVPGSADVVLMRAEALQAQDLAADAERMLAEAHAKNPKEAAFLLPLIGVAERRSDWAETETLLKELEALTGDGVTLRVQQAQFLARRQGKAAASALRKLAEGTGKFSDKERVVLWANLLDPAAQVGDITLADELCAKIAEKEPNNAQVRYLQFARTLNGGKPADQDKALAEIDRVAGQGSRWFYGKAMLTLLRAKGGEEALKSVQKALGDPAKARNLQPELLALLCANGDKDALNQALEDLTKARELQSDWSAIPRLMAGIYDELGKPEQALTNYREAVEMGERNPVAVLRLVLLLVQTRKLAEADKWLRQFEQEQPEGLPANLSRAAVEVAMALDDTDRAVEKARKAAPADSKNHLEQLWLGQMLGVAGRRIKAAAQDLTEPDKSEQIRKADDLLADAEKAVRRAVELEPKLPLTWLTLVQFLVSIGEEGKADQAAQEAAKNISAKDAPLALAQIDEARNKMDSAEEKFKAALAAQSQNVAVVRAVALFYVRAGKIESAESLLLKLVDGKLKANQEDVAWARGQLAAIYFTRGGHQNRMKARELVQKNFSEGSPSMLDRRLDYSIDANDPDPVRREEAVRKMEEMRKSQLATPDDYFQLAQMYLAAGDWTKASAEFRSLVSTSEKDPNTPKYLFVYISALLPHGETSSAENYLDRLEKLLPKQFLVVSLRADLLLAKKEPRKAMELLDGFIERTDVQPEKRDQRERLVAEKLFQLVPRLTGKEQKPVADEFARRAETLFRDYLKQNPGQDLVLAPFLAHVGKVGEALDLLEEKLEQTSAPDFALACSAIWQGGGKFTAGQAERLDGIVQKAVGRFERPVPLLSLLAEVRSRQGRYADTEAFYREVLKKQSGDAVTMNNLAVLLALEGVKLDEALRLMNQAVEIAGRVGAMLDSRASVYMAMNDPDNALSDIRAAVADAETPVRLFHLAQASKLAGQDKEARETMDKALKQGLTPDMLQPLELPAFEKMRQLPR